MNVSRLEHRQKRAIYRASYRGTKEMDWLLGRFTEARVSDYDEDRLTILEAFLLLPDPQLENWIMGRDNFIDEQYQPLVEEIRRFHDLL